MKNRKNRHPKLLAAAAATALTLPGVTAAILANENADPAGQTEIPGDSNPISQELIQDIQTNEGVMEIPSTEDSGSGEQQSILNNNTVIQGGSSSEDNSASSGNANLQSEDSPDDEEKKNLIDDDSALTELSGESVQSPLADSGIMKIKNLVNAKENQAEFERYNVLILDTSGSMWGNPMSAQKEASKKFIDALFDADGANGLRIIALNSYSYELGHREFSDDKETHINSVNSLYANGGTNFSAALSLAGEYLRSISDVNSSGKKTIKNIILCSDGLPERGEWNNDFDRYSKYHASVDAGYANAAYILADDLKNKGINIHTLGFFHRLYGNDLSMGRALMQDIASRADYYHEVTNPADLEFSFGDIATDINKTQSFEFIYSSAGNHKGICYINDDYFIDTPAATWNRSLATLSMSMAFSAYGSETGGTNNYEKKSENIEDFFQKAGFDVDSIRVNEHYNIKPTTDSIGVAAALKTLRDGSTLIGLAFRGGGYEAEWGGNFKMNYEGNHFGFEYAKAQAMNFITNYIISMQVAGLINNSKVKFWLSGYSRSAAVANLTAAEINRNAEKKWLNLEYDPLKDVFAYCFECPQATTDENRSDYCYRNIHNIINLNDLVPRVAPVDYQFGRYGVDFRLPDRGSYPENYQKILNMMLEHYKNFENYTDKRKYSVEDFEMKCISLRSISSGEKGHILPDRTDLSSQSLFLDKLLPSLIRDLAPTREAYADRLQDCLVNILSILNSATPREVENLKNIVIKKLQEQVFGFDKSQLAALPVTFPYIVKKSVEESGIRLTDEQRDSLYANLNVAEIKLINAFVSAPNYLLTAIMNIGSIGNAHYPELCWSWLASMDPNYQEKDESGNLHVSHGYRTIRINCSVDLNLYNEKGELVASIIDNQPVNTKSEYNYVFGVDGDGQKYFVVPDYGNYRLEVNATGSGNVDISVDEFSYSRLRNVRSANFDNMQMTIGDQFITVIPGYSDDDLEADSENGSTVNYLLLGVDGSSIDPTFDVRGKELAESVYRVTVNINDKDAGTASYGGSRGFGDYIRLEAEPSEGCTFEGWYENGNLVSSDLVYRLQVYSDHNLEARFNKPSNSENNPSNSGSESQSTKPSSSSTVKLSRVDRIYSVKQNESLATVEAASAVSSESASVPTAASEGRTASLFTMAISALGLSGLLASRKRKSSSEK